MVHFGLQHKQETLEKIRKIADYQFGKAAGNFLFPNGVNTALSRKTGRIRHVRCRDRLLATLRPTDGTFSLTIDGAKRLIRANAPSLWAKVSEEAASFISKGKSVFAKHIIDADAEIRPHDEVIVLDKGGNVLAVGKAVLTGTEMKLFTRGLAVRVRRGVDEKRKNQVKQHSGRRRDQRTLAVEEPQNC